MTSKGKKQKSRREFLKKTALTAAAAGAANLAVSCQGNNRKPQLNLKIQARRKPKICPILPTTQPQFPNQKMRFPKQSVTTLPNNRQH
ncbi:MAG: twin-arginine translocation signal domain-containing protein [Microcoleus sp. SU_5_6]|nr:twin-arginine translocation signal domain-containing protein [Microcoleus sp. SU_5_6]